MIGQLQNVLQQDGYAINSLIDELDTAEVSIAAAEANIATLQGAFASGTFTPTFTFATPGDLSNAYTTQLGDYYRIGSLVFINLQLNVTPTFTTASGTVRIGGLPFITKTSSMTPVLPVQCSAPAIAWPGGRTAVFAFAPSAVTYLGLAAQGTAIGALGLQASDFTSGAATNNIIISGVYVTDAEDHP